MKRRKILAIGNRCECRGDVVAYRRTVHWPPNRSDTLDDGSAIILNRSPTNSTIAVRPILEDGYW